MTQEQFEQMRQCSEHIKAWEEARSLIPYSTMEMNFGNDPMCEKYKIVADLYYYLIPKEERDKLTTDYRAKMIALIDEEIKRSKEKFEQI